MLRNGHVHTAWAGLARPISDPGYERERLELPDGDYVDLDRLSRGNRRVAIVSHGLEGHSHRPYMRGMARGPRPGRMGCHRVELPRMQR